MILVKVARCLLGGSAEIELPKPNMKMDPRPNNWSEHPYDEYTFQCHYDDKNSTKVTVVMNESDRSAYFNPPDTYAGPIEFRVYDPAKETVPDFGCLKYTYLGLDGERSLSYMTELSIDPSVKIIKKNAFSGAKIGKCFINDGVYTIEEKSFYRCNSPKFIRLPSTLQVICRSAFEGCYSLEALFLPPSIQKIEDFAFRFCDKMKILSLPHNIKKNQIGREILVDYSQGFFDITRIKRYERSHSTRGAPVINSNQVNQSLINYYRNLPPLHKACLNTNVTSQIIKDTIANHGPTFASTTSHDRMTPLHILVINPNADSGAISACLDANMNTAFMRDGGNKTPLDYLKDYEHRDIEDHTSFILALCMYREKQGEASLKRKRETDLV